MTKNTTETHESAALLWQKIAGFPLDEADAALPFSKKLAKENNWTDNFTERAIEEYRKFLLLCCISPQGASPSKVVDEVWHLHLLYTRNYWETFCENTIGRAIHHQPSAGGRAERKRHEDWQAATLDAYRDFFGSEPPYDIWIDQPPKRQRWSLLRSFSSGKLRAMVTVLLCLCLCGCGAGDLFPIGFILLLIAVSEIRKGLSGPQDAMQKRKHEGDGSSVSSSGDHGSSCGSDSSSCSSSCGSGCGGCGGGGD